jgi:hypothetical protein
LSGLRCLGSFHVMISEAGDRMLVYVGNGRAVGHGRVGEGSVTVRYATLRAYQTCTLAREQLIS